ncbi:hypothetical protein [Bacillus sp. FJAT-45350]|uniref:hypothetical protein n=1 Tax=Bacillus sp. FJAT-45350 TaxID=2011014 RepID=UPI000BB753A7|nr:hypothetical protein [Bacillus sp. FJAT-45350]
MSSQSNSETTPEQRRIGDRRKRFGNKKSIYISLSVLLWLGLFYVGYSLAFNYFEENQTKMDEKIESISFQNEEILSQLEQFNLELQSSTEEISLIKDELSYIYEGLELTGESLTGSDQTRLALEERMIELDKRLNDLRTQLVKLEEATRAH